MQIQQRSIDQKRRLNAYRNFISRLPPHAREPEIWLRYLHLVRSAYASPFAAVFSIDDEGLLVIDWVDARLDAAFSEFVQLIEAQGDLLSYFEFIERPAPVVLVRDWACVRLSYFCQTPAIGIAVHIGQTDERAIDTTVLHSFEKVVSTCLALPERHEKQSASLPWCGALSRDRSNFRPELVTLTNTTGER